MTAIRMLLLCFLGVFTGLLCFAQRTYKPNSVLSSGNWYKLAVSGEGVYKIDLAFLNSLGISGSIPSANIRLFGNGGAMLPEGGNAIPVDDLEENAIFISDGGDGTLNGSDYMLFFAPGPHQWTKDSLNKRFSHHKNIYSDRSFYYLSIGGNGLRVASQTNPPAAANTVNTFNERYFHELDTINFLTSGKEWFGEEFSNAPGRTLSRTFNLPLTDLANGPASIISHAVARSINAVSRFTISINNQPIQQLNINPVSTGIYDLFVQQAQGTDNFNMGSSTAAVTITYTQGSFNSQGWLNWFEFFARRNLVLPPAKQLLFRDWNSIGSGTAAFLISNADATTQVWDVTDYMHPVRMSTTLNGSQLRFTTDVQRLREFVSFSSSFLVPEAVGRVTNQNLHATVEKDYFIISHPDFVSQAERLAQFHQQKGLRTLVITTEQVFNEFSSGTPDPTAIRDFVKMYYDRYRTTWTQPKSLLLFGRASFDYKDRINGNTNFVPAYESVNSTDPLSTYTSDDFFGFLDDHEDINSTVVVNELDLGIGRIPSRSAEEGKNFVDKLLDYHSPSSFGPWRNMLNFVADDEDYNVHLQDAEVLTATSASTNPILNIQKIYLDAFQQESGSSGGRYPQANAMINNNIYNGTLIWNYSGHGGPQRLAEEVVIDQQIVNGWNNRYKLPLFITATCDFAPYDNPGVNALGENLLVRPKTGAIALMTTTRVVFAFSNRIMNNNYLRFALEPDASGKYKNLGEAMRVAKNYTYQTFSDIVNNRKFVLLGDPAMTLAYPTLKLAATKLNGVDISASQSDTLSATEEVILEGEVRDIGGTLLSNFNGTAYLSLFDKVQSITTLANDPTSLPVSFQTQEQSLFKGKASVLNGKFLFKFRVPKDINYQYGKGKISLYAQNGTVDGNGYSTNVVVGGIAATTVVDQQGPDIRAYLNDDRFVNGGLSNSSPVLLLKLADSSGINTGGSGVDHDIVATLDNDNNQFFILNSFYETDIDDYQKGSVRFQLPQLKPGHHTLRIKAWDVMNNSNETTIEFTVVNDEELQVAHVLNYPNPFTTNTAFWFEHNQPGLDLSVKVEVFTVSGKLIKTLSQTINTVGNRSSEVVWDGKDDFGNRIARGVYIYRLRIKAPNGRVADKWERLVILGK